jgi:hypothetical protein
VTRSAVALVLASVLLAQDKPKHPPKEAPAIRYPIPLAVSPGQKTKVTLRGAKLDGVTAVTAADGVAAKVLGKGKKAAVPNGYPADQLGDTEIEVEVDVPKGFAAGHASLVAVVPGGKSEPYRLTVSLPGIAEKEPNDGFDQAQEITLPATIEGTIGREKDVDVFRFAGKKGQTVTVRADAAKFGSPADLLLTVSDADKRTLKLVDDVNGLADPTVTLTLPADGVYFISLIESRDLAGPAFGYRLRVE